MRDHVAADLRQFHRLKMLNEGPRCDWVFNRFKPLPFLIKTFNNFTLKEGGRKLSDRKSEVDSSQIIFDKFNAKLLYFSFNKLSRMKGAKVSLVPETSWGISRSNRKITPYTAGAMAFWWKQVSGFVKSVKGWLFISRTALFWTRDSGGIVGYRGGELKGFEL